MKKFLYGLLALALATLPASADIMSQPYAFVTSTRTTPTQATGGTSQVALVANKGRKSWCVENYSTASESTWIDFGVASVIGSSQEIQKGQTLCFGGSAVWQGAVTMNNTTTAHQVTFFEFQ